MSKSRTLFGSLPFGVSSDPYGIARKGSKPTYEEAMGLVRLAKEQLDSTRDWSRTGALMGVVTPGASALERDQKKILKFWIEYAKQAKSREKLKAKGRSR